ncbi:hypothetical protein TDB9533_04612 [Thalassocella blandensis]|nr:hypothetical protein TDB9533_04612 [Thalassocella blandensis]
MKIDFPRLIQELSVNLQQPLMEPVEDACRISWDSIDMHVYYHNDSGENLVILLLEFSDIPKEVEHRVFQLLLNANYLWVASDYATLSINPETRKASICDKHNADLLNADDLTARVKELYQTALYWKEIIEDESHNHINVDAAETIGMNDNFAIRI